MIKVHLGRKKSEEGLRPLSEKEIQHRLYGAYQQGEPPLKERIEAEFLDPLRKEKPFSFPGGSTSKASPSGSWKNGAKTFGRGILGTGGFLRSAVGRVGGKGVRWLILVVAAAILFLGVYALNLYRTEAMKNAKPPVSPPQRVRPLRITAVKLSPAESPKEVAQQELPVVPEAPAPERVETPALALPEEKPYVVQICTYAREGDARELVGRMVEAGLSAFVKPLKRGNGKTFYPVFLGRYRTQQEAQQKLQEFRRQPMARDFPDIFVRSL